MKRTSKDRAGSKKGQTSALQQKMYKAPDTATAVTTEGIMQGDEVSVLMHTTSGFCSLQQSQGVGELAEFVTSLLIHH